MSKMGLVTAAVIVGAGTGVLAAVLIWTLEYVTRFAHWLQNLIVDPFGLLVGLVFAGLIVGFAVERWAPEAKGHGVPEVIKAVALRSGRISG